MALRGQGATSFGGPRTDHSQRGSSANPDELVQQVRTCQPVSAAGGVTLKPGPVLLGRMWEVWKPQAGASGNAWSPGRAELGSQVRASLTCPAAGLGGRALRATRRLRRGA